MQFKLSSATGEHHFQLLSSLWSWLFPKTAKRFVFQASNQTHPFLANRLSYRPSIWEGPLNEQLLGYLQHHRVEGAAVFPGAAYVEAGLAIHRQLYRQEDLALENLKFHRTLLLNNGDQAILRVVCDDRTGSFTIYSRNQCETSDWLQHAGGILSTESLEPSYPVKLRQLRHRCCEPVDIEQLYRQLYNSGLQYGPYFRAIRKLWRAPGEVLAHIELHEALIPSGSRYCLHPTLLDACFQSLIATLEVADGEHPLYLPVRIGRVRYRASPGQRFCCHGHLSRQSKGGIEADFGLYDDDGNVFADVRGLRCLRLRLDRGRPGSPSTDTDSHNRVPGR
jgi:acyl transferase domain-containing protein